MLRWLWLSLVTLLTDQATKFWVEAEFLVFEVREVLPFFNLTLVYNEGAAFSFLSDAGGWQRWFFIGLAAAVSLVLMVWLSRLRRGESLVATSLTLIIGGAVGNMIDRVRAGRVIDFLDFHWAGWHYPSFNVADIALSIGVALMLLDAVRQRPAR